MNTGSEVASFVAVVVLCSSTEWTTNTRTNTRPWWCRWSAKAWILTIDFNSSLRLHLNFNITRTCAFLRHTSPLARDGSGSLMTSLRCSLQMTPAWLIEWQLCRPQSLWEQRSMSYSLPPHLTSSNQNLPFPRPNGLCLRDTIEYSLLKPVTSTGSLTAKAVVTFYSTSAG